MRTTATWTALCALASAWVVLGVSPAAARRGGIAAEGCNGCHQGGQPATVRVSASPADPAPGQTITLSVEIDASNGPVGGFYLRSDGTGTLAASGSGTRLLAEDQVVHSSPKSATSGVVRFEVGWTAPAAPGGSVFHVWAVSGNGNDGSGGDGTGEAVLLLVYGCAGETFALDPDGDGFGSEEYGQKRDCSLPAGYARRGGDCAEYDAQVHPEAVERCNDRDDDCDGAIDEGLPVGPQYTDADGDGHGAGDEAIMDCSSPEGYAATRDDCDDASSTVHPDASEVCNYQDDDCDGSSDEDARADCGTGWCRRLSSSCSPDFCTPGEPRAEMCNALDDDCDEAVDEDVSCAPGEVCAAGVCAPEDEAEAATAGSAGSARPPGAPAAGGTAPAARPDATAGGAGDCSTDITSAGACAPAVPPDASEPSGCRTVSAAGASMDMPWLALWLMGRRYRACGARRARVRCAGEK